MKRICLLPLLVGLGLFAGGCRKQQSDTERNAEIERQVQQRLVAERQAEQQQNLAQRQAELDAREQALKERENRPVATATPAATIESPNETHIAASRTETGSYATFYRKLDPNGTGWKPATTATSFNRASPLKHATGDRTRTATGFTPMRAGSISEESFGWATYHYGRWIRLRESHTSLHPATDPADSETLALDFSDCYA